MSGTLVGVVDCLHTSGAVPLLVDRQQNVFVNVYDFMQRHVTVGNAALHASNFGSGGTGFDYHDGANPAGENAWAVFRFLASASSIRTTDFYVLIQWAENSAIGASPGDPGSFENGTFTDGIGIMMAYREDGGDPWNGTTNANGADTKGTPVWTGTGLHVMSEYNETGARSADKEDLSLLLDTSSSTSVRFHCCGDADGMWFARDGGFGNSISGTLDQVAYLGVYIPRAGLAVSSPYIFGSNVISVLPASQSMVTGDASGHIGTDASQGVYAYRVHKLTFAEQLQQPEDIGNGLEYVDLPLYVSSLAVNESMNKGFIGSLSPDIIRLAYGPANGSANAAFTRAFLGDSATAADYKFSLAWGGGAGPNLAPDRDGLVF